MAPQTDDMQPAPAGYYYLWHLAALGIISADFGPAPLPVPAAVDSAVRNTPAPVINGTLWDTIAVAGPISAARVALIDVGISPDHPNLASRIDHNASIDLTTHRYGSRALDILDDTDSFFREQKQHFFSGLEISTLGNLGLSNDDKDYLGDIVAEYAASEGVLRRLLDVNGQFASHGTSCAGLIAGQPSAIVSRDGATPLLPKISLSIPVRRKRNPAKISNLLPYFGADPFPGSSPSERLSSRMPNSSSRHFSMPICKMSMSSCCLGAFPTRAEVLSSRRTT
jgi:subtilisin family serine protease